MSNGDAAGDSTSKDCCYRRYDGDDVVEGVPMKIAIRLADP